MTKVTKKKIKLKEPFISILKIIGFVLCIIIGLFIFYNYEISTLTKYGYSRLASKNILFSLKKDDVLLVGKNKTLNAAFESDDYKEKYFTNYTKIDYVNQKHLIKNINKFIKIGYTNSEISIILKHGNDKDVSEFTKRDRIRYLEEFYSYDFAKLSLYDRYVAYSNETGEDDDVTVIYVNSNLDKEPYTDSKKVTEFSETMLINKYNYVDKDFEPDDLVKISSKYTDEEDMYASRVAYNAFIEMYNAASKENLGLSINSAYRSYDDQQEIVDTYTNLYGDDYVTKYVARAGFSEHESGLSFDVGSTNNKTFVKSNEYTWMVDNAYKYGFVLRYQKSYEDITLFKSEAWHFRYVGKKIAKYMYEHDMSFEEYYVRFLDK